MFRSKSNLVKIGFAIVMMAASLTLAQDTPVITVDSDSKVLGNTTIEIGEKYLSLNAVSNDTITNNAETNSTTSCNKTNTTN
jgi:hypothetical protein